MREDHVASVRAMLTPEQLPKYEQLRAERELRAKQAKSGNAQSNSAGVATPAFAYSAFAEGVLLPPISIGL